MATAAAMATRVSLAIDDETGPLDDLSNPYINDVRTGSSTANR